MPGTERFGPDRRLPDKAAFDNVFAAPDIRLRRHPFSLLARRSDVLPCPALPARLGLVIGKRHARRAVDRNRIRRFARECFRRSDLEHFDIIILARPGAAGVEPESLRAAIAWLIARLERETLAGDTNNEAAS